MSRKSRYVPLEKRVVMLADLVELNNIQSDNQVDLIRYNALEEALALMESREPILKEFINHKAHPIKVIIWRIKWNIKWLCFKCIGK